MARGEPPLLNDSPTALLTDGGRLLLIGEPGSGKSTLMKQLASQLAERGEDCLCLTADPGSPAFGAPGALALARWCGHWEVQALTALCTLDAARFRLPLALALRELAAAAGPHLPLIIDAPGLMRGVAAAELLPALVQATGADRVLLISPEQPQPLRQELRALPIPVWRQPPHPEAVHPGRDERARARTALWDAYLAASRTLTLPLGALALLGTPPPRAAAAAWRGRQIALLAAGRTLALGEVEALEEGRLRLRVPAFPGRADALLIRDAGRDEASGWLRTRKPHGGSAPAAVDPQRPRLQIGAAEAELVNGLSGDPLLHLRLAQQRRSLLFDLGESGRLPAAAAHQVSDVFITHAHIDHIGGFIWLLRTRIGPFPPCRLYGPQGLAANIDGLLRGVLWDRIGDSGPVFEINEVRGDRVHRFRAQAGLGCRAEGERALVAGVVLEEPEFRVRAATLDHLGTASIAYCYEPADKLHVRRERLAELAPGPWLGELKHRFLRGDRDTRLALPGGREATVAALAAELIEVEPGRKLAYATDFADTAENRRRLMALAQEADLFVCEASFREVDRAQAVRTGHLTARACGEIATAARVRRLLPFHFSRRYEREQAALVDEVRAACPRTLSVGLPRAEG